MTAPKVWLFEFFHELRGSAGADSQAVGAHFDAYLDLWASAECRGFDGIFFTEHPIPDDRWLATGGHDAQRVVLGAALELVLIRADDLVVTLGAMVS